MTEIKPGVFTSGLPNMRVYDLKTELLAIKEKYMLQPMSKQLIDEMNQEFTRLLKHFNLEDLQFSITTDTDAGTVNFIPRREIDKWAFKGIFSNT